MESKGKVSVAVAYFRCSTPGQRDEGVSLQAQEFAVKEWCGRHGVTLGQTFMDGGMGGGRADNREGLQGAIAAACKGKMPLLVYDLARFSRNLKDILIIEEALKRKGSALVSVTEALDTGNPDGRMYFQLRGMFAEHERNRISARTRQALRYKASRGERVGEIAFGFDLAADGVHVKPNASEREAIAFMVGLRAEGQSLREIAAALEAQGVRTKKGGSKWHAKVIAAILRQAERREEGKQIAAA